MKTKVTVVALCALALYVGFSLPVAAYESLDKEEMCHLVGTPAQRTMIVNSNAAAGHRAHGDTYGACP